MTDWRAAGAEFIGTGALVACVVGSGIMGERLAAGNAAVALLANSFATALGLFVLIVTLAGLSGAHFNPWVTLREAVRGAMPTRDAFAYVVAQVAGGLAGVVAAHAMFGMTLIQQGANVREAPGLLLGEVIATAGLILTIRLGRSRSLEARAALVACWIGAAYWFTSSTSFANAAVTVARALTDSFSGIRPVDVAPFLVAQAVGAAAGEWLAGVLEPPSRTAR